MTSRFGKLLELKRMAQVGLAQGQGASSMAGPILVGAVALALVRSDPAGLPDPTTTTATTCPPTYRPTKAMRPRAAISPARMNPEFRWSSDLAYMQ